jgi:hypothetical protein
LHVREGDDDRVDLPPGDALAQLVEGQHGAILTALLPARATGARRLFAGLTAPAR